MILEEDDLILKSEIMTAAEAKTVSDTGAQGQDDWMADMARLCATTQPKGGDS